MFPYELYNAYYMSDKGAHPAGRLLNYDGNLHLLEDYYGMLEPHVPEGFFDEYTAHCLNHPPQKMVIAKEKDQKEGFHPELIPELATTARMPVPKNIEPLDVFAALRVPERSVFEYHRHGLLKPSKLESHSTGEMFLDGNELTDAEKQLVMDNLATGLATLAHSGTLAKALPETKGLQKSDPFESLAYFDKLHRETGNEEALKHLNALRQSIAVDPLTGVGNRAAFNDHIKKNQPGTWVVSDMNDFRNINSEFGHQVGDQAIQAKFNAAKAAQQEVGQENMKIFRPMGDEGHYFFHKPEHAYQFIRAFQKHLDQVPNIGGTHKLSVSTGIGPTLEHADQAMYGAKEQKKAFKATNPTLQTQTPHFHSTHETMKVGQNTTPTIQPTPLTKGVMTKRAPFNPETAKKAPAGNEYSKITGKNVDLTVKDRLGQWSGQDDRGRQALGEIGMNEEARERSLHKLHGKTQVRKGAGGLEFLLHRGVPGHAGDEYADENHSGWTPDPQVAKRFGNVFSSWIPEKSLRFDVRQYGNFSSPGPHPYANENEFIVAPGVFRRAT